MTINEAVQSAKEKDGFITLPELAGKWKIKPTDSPQNCILMKWDGTHKSVHGWQPSAKDLTRDDWITVVSPQAT